jgi:hypothetical protein
MFLSKKLNMGAGIPAPIPDPQFNYVTMLLHGDGTNGAQNNTFLDGSTNNFTITRLGNTTQGSFSPYGSNWSNYFDGASRIFTASNSAFVLGTGDFTIECWINMASGTTLLAYWRSFLSVGADGTSDGNGVTLYVTDGGSGSSVAGEVAVNIGAATRIYSGQDIRGLGWVHVALTRQGTTNRLFLNGVLKSTITNSLDINATNYGASVGLSSVANSNYFIGYISNARVVKGTAVYTSNFTPSTTPLTVISGTSLLTCADNRFIDESTNNFAFTTVGTPSVQRFNPFGTSTDYSTSVIGGSLYTDGSGALQLPTNEALAPRTSDFTFECWLYSRDAFTNSYGGIYVGDPTFGIFIGQLASGLFGVRQRSNADLLSRTSPPIRQWIHIAVSRSGTSLRMFYNGIQQGATVTDSTDFYSGSTSITDNNFAIYGYLSNLRFVKGSAVYTSNFTPPTSPVTAITNTQLLTNFTNGAIFDNAMINNLETAGNAQISTSVVKYGTGSLYFDGTGDCLVGLSRPSMSFVSNNFTVEAWVYRQVTGGTTQTIYQKGRVGDSNFELSFAIDTTNQLWVYYSTDGTTATLVATTTALVPQNTWTHIAVTRSGSTWRVFIGGTLDVSATASVTLYTGAGAIAIAANSVGDNPFTGYIDDLRITNGFARYTANFTPPTQAFSNFGPY